MTEPANCSPGNREAELHGRGGMKRQANKQSLGDDDHTYEVQELDDRR